MNESGFNLEQLKQIIKEQCYKPNGEYVGSYGMCKLPTINTYQGMNLLKEIEELQKKANKGR